MSMGSESMSMAVEKSDCTPDKNFVQWKFNSLDYIFETVMRKHYLLVILVFWQEVLQTKNRCGGGAYPIQPFRF